MNASGSARIRREFRFLTGLSGKLRNLHGRKIPGGDEPAFRDDLVLRVDRAFQAFFRRLKAGETPGYPRFKGRARFDTVEFPSYGDGCKWAGRPGLPRT